MIDLEHMWSNHIEKMSSTTLSISKAQKLLPARLLKQLHATIAIKCYDHIFVDDNMTTNFIQIVPIQCR